MSEILKFSTNIPEEVALRSTSGKRVEGRYGDQVMYVLFDDRVMYVPPIVASRIDELDIAAGEPIEICKAELRNGNRRWIEWQVRKVDPGQERAPDDRPAKHAEAQKEAAKKVANASGLPNSRFEAAADGTLLPAPITGRGVTVMELSMNAAAEVAQRVENRAALRNQSLHFTSEDVRAIGLTMFIQASREGAVRWEV
jgi:hypothetical protein